MWTTLLKIALNFIFGKIYQDVIKPWLEELKENENFQRAIELAQPLIVKFEEDAYTTIMTGYEKKEAVLENLKIQLKEEGIEIATYLLNNAIEMGVTALTRAGVINK